MNRDDLFVSLIIALCSFCFGVGVGGCTAESLVHREAVKHGALRYEADPTTGKVKAVWVPEGRK